MLKLLRRYDNNNNNNKRLDLPALCPFYTSDADADADAAAAAAVGASTLLQYCFCCNIFNVDTQMQTEDSIISAIFISNITATATTTATTTNSKCIALTLIVYRIVTDITIGFNIVFVLLISTYSQSLDKNHDRSACVSCHPYA
uniref:Uncharacterized protein n=1 Tax=Glossina pallidipes TaxID=7398 RepID=A0A1A9ZMP6_GLOPL